MTHLKFFKKQKAMFLRHTLTKNYNGTYWPLLVLRGFGLVLVVRVSFCGGFGDYWVLEVADLGPLPLLVGMGDPWMLWLLWAGFGHWWG